MTEVAQPNIDNQPPSEVRDLRVLLLLDEESEDSLSQQQHQQVTVIWTAPGDDLDIGTGQLSDPLLWHWDESMLIYSTYSL